MTAKGYAPSRKPGLFGARQDDGGRTGGDGGTGSEIGRIVADASALEQVFEENGQDWTMARPPQLTDKPYAGRYRVGVGRPAGFSVSKSRARMWPIS